MAVSLALALLRRSKLIVIEQAVARIEHLRLYASESVRWMRATINASQNSRRYHTRRR